VGRIKKELFEFNNKTNEILFDYCSYYEDSLILKFLNFKFENKNNEQKNREELIDLFEYDRLLSQSKMLDADSFHLLDDYNNDFQHQVTYFNLLQEEINQVFNEILYPKSMPKSLIPNGRFQALETEIQSLGSLRYELIFGELHLKWDDNIKSFRQVLFRSLVEFFKGDKNVLSNLSRCQNKECRKYYFNKKNNPKFCTPLHGKIANDKNRDQSKRHKFESSRLEYARNRIIERKYK
jgi:hypothetical protein